MLTKIKEFQKQASELGRNPNSVNEFRLWIAAKEGAKINSKTWDKIKTMISEYDFSATIADDAWYEHVIPALQETQDGILKEKGVNPNQISDDERDKLFALLVNSFKGSL